MPPNKTNWSYDHCEHARGACARNARTVVIKQIAAKHAAITQEVYGE
jgi:hypothetical protein